MKKVVFREKKGQYKLSGDELIPALLSYRGVTDEKELTLSQNLIPYKYLKDIKKAALRLANAILNKEKIVVVADYDCDGATACAIAVSGLSALGANIDYVVPNRMIHGYGLTPSVVDVTKDKNPDIILTVDNGIASIEGIEYANQLGIEVIVTDHHLPGDITPNAFAIVNPNQKGCEFPSKNLAGCGVMFYVFVAVRDAIKAIGNNEIKEAIEKVNVYDWLDLTALGTIADVVKLDANNRLLVDKGLKRIRQGLMRPGISALFHVSNKDYMHATSQDFGFALGPRLNAAGRLADMSIGIQCLLEKDYEKAVSLAQELNSLNEQRKNIEKEMQEKAISQIDIEDQNEMFTRVVFGENFHEGVIGIVAGRIKESSYCPTIVFAPMEGGWKGSGRSIPGCHLRDVLDAIYKKHPAWFIKFGGHSMAAGLSITNEAKPHFQEAFEEEVRAWFNNKKQNDQIIIDGELLGEDLNFSNAEKISKNVWGQGFEEPNWIGTFLIKDVKTIGKDNNHLKFSLIHEDNQEEFSALHFFQNNIDDFNAGDYIDIVYKMSCNYFMDKNKVDLIVVDYLKD